MIVVIATVTCEPGERSNFLAEFHKIVPDVLNELGCLEYSPTIDAETDLKAQACEEDRVTIVEKWSDLAALDRHLAAPHMVEYRPKVASMIKSTELRILSATC